MVVRERELLRGGAALDAVARPGCYALRWMSEALPDFVVRLLWDVDPSTLDVEHDCTLIFERVMSRGGWDAMRWLRGRYPKAQLAEFIRGDGGRRLSPRDLAYWALVCDVDVEPAAGGGRPRWAGP